MTKDDALLMAIEYIDKLKSTGQTNWLEINVIQNACKEALEQPTQEPVAWMNDIAFSMDKDELTAEKFGDIIPLYTHPKQWQGLSDDEIEELFPDESKLFSLEDFARAIEAKLREKNNG